MARIRSMKPETFSSETLARCSLHARWTFAGLWCYVDDEARGRANAGLIKAAVWPLDDDITPGRVAAFLDELEAERLICRYEVDGKRYVHVVNFGEHQHPNRPVASKLPACSRRTHGGLTASSVSPHPGNPAGDSGEGDEGTGAGHVAESAENGQAPGQPAGQTALTANSVSAHGARTAKSSGMPPTPNVVDTGDGDGDVGGDGVPPTAGAGKPRAGGKPKQLASGLPAGCSPGAEAGSASANGLSITQRSKRITDAYAAAEPMCKWPAVNGVVIKAIRSEKYTDEEIRSALLRMAAENRAVTVDSLRTELGGLPPRRSAGAGRQANFADEEYTRGWK